MTDGAGNATGCSAAINCQRLSYDEYGLLGAGSIATGQPYRYTGRRFDAETGLYYYRARYYAPELGRFLQTDPIGYLDDFNLYAYARNDPLNFVDSTGRAPNQAGATNFPTIQAELRANGSLDDLATNHLNNVNRYFFTDAYGWVDVRHFATAASMTASGTWGWVKEGLGLGTKSFSGPRNGEITTVAAFRRRICRATVRELTSDNSSVLAPTRSTLPLLHGLRLRGCARYI